MDRNVSQTAPTFLAVEKIRQIFSRKLPANEMKTKVGKR